MKRRATRSFQRVKRRTKRVASIVLSGSLLANLSTFGSNSSSNDFSFSAHYVFAQETFDDESNATFSTSTNRWRVDRRLGRVVALNAQGSAPIWSPSGVVYRAKPLRIDRSSVFSDSVVCVELNGLVYFQFAEFVRVDQSSTLLEPQGRLVAFDPQKEGRVAWIVKGEDVDKLFSQAFGGEFELNPASCLFVEKPRSKSTNLLAVVAERADRRLELTLDASSGKLVSYVAR